MAEIRRALLEALGIEHRTVGPKAVYERTITIRATVAANQPVNSLIPISLLIDPTLPSVSVFTIPRNEVWVIDDIFVRSTQSVDGFLKLRKNQREEVLPVSQPINSLLISNPSRPRITPITYNPMDIIDGYFINLSSPTSATTVEVLMHVTVYVY